MKTRLLRLVLFTTLFCCCTLITTASTTLTVASYDVSNTSSSLSEGTSNYVVYYFTIKPSANVSFSPQVINIQHTGDLTNGVMGQSAATLNVFSGASTSPTSSTGRVASYTTSSYGGNDQSVSFSSISPLNLTGGVTYYFYLILSLQVTSNQPSSNITFSISASGLTQNYNASTDPSLSVTNTSSKAYSIAANFHWLPVNNPSTSWSNSNNWAIGSATATTGNANRVPSSTDNVFIGVVPYNSSYQPTYDGSSSPAAVSITFGAAQPVASSDVSAIKLTVSNPLTISGDIMQKCDYNITKIYLTEIAGTAAVTANNLILGDGVTTPTINGTSAAAAVVWSNTNTASKINADIQIKGIYPTYSSGSAAPQYIIAGPATFLLRNGTLTCDRVVFTNASTSSYSSFCLDLSALNFSAITNIAGVGTLKVMNAAPFVKATQGTTQIVTTTNASTTNTTIEYGGASQAVLTQPSGTVAAASTQNRYDNVTYSGSGIKTPDGTSSQTMTVGGSFTNSGTSTVDFSINNPALSVTGTLTNNSGATIKQGSGAMSVTGAITNAGTITGSSGAFTTPILQNNAGIVTFGAGTATITTVQNNAGIINLGTGTATVTTLQNSGGAIKGNAASGTFNIGTGGLQNQDYNGASTFACNAEAVNITGAYSNSGTSTFTGGSGTVYFNLAGNQTLTDNSTSTGTSFTNVNFGGTATGTGVTNTKTLSSSGTGKFSVSSTGVLTMAGNATLAAGGYLTLKSDASGSAALAKLPSTGTYITGNVNVQRFFTGGGSSANRGYRLMSSPVNQTSAALNITNGYATNGYNLTFIKNGAFTGGSGTGFSGPSAGPTLYLYNETKTPSNSTFTSGKYIGINSINTTSGAMTLSDNSTLASIPIGNGYMFYFVGSLSLSTGATRTTGSLTASGGGVPTDATTISIGYLNQGDFTMKLWYTPPGGSVGKLSYTSTLATPGLNMVGNPYASTLSLSQLLSDNSNAITGISKIYVLNSRTGGSTGQSFVAFDATQTSSPTTQPYAVSGGGFIVQAKSNTSVLQFKESQKATANYSGPTGSSLIMSTPLAQSSAIGNGFAAAENGRALASVSSTTGAPAVTGLYVKLEQDSTIYDYCGIYFNKNYSAKFADEDALDLNATTSRTYMASLSADGMKTSINSMPDYRTGSRVKLYVAATVSGLYKLKLEGVRNIDTLYDIYLIDKYKKDSLDIRRYGTYNFNLVSADTATYGANRFELSIRRRPLPSYQLIAFAAAKNTNGSIKVSWKVYNEGTYTGFTLEKQDGNAVNYKTLYERQSDGSSIYSFVDNSPSTGLNIYRLKQNDVDSKITYSNVVTVDMNTTTAAESLFSVYPNPTAERISINVNVLTNPVASTGTYKLNIYNNSGLRVMQKTSASTNWSESLVSLLPGVYVVEVQRGDGSTLGKTKLVKTN